MSGKATRLVGHPVRVADGVWTLPGDGAEALLSPRATSVCLWGGADLRVYAWPSLAPRRASPTPVAGRLRALVWADEATLLGLVETDEETSVVRWDADGGEALDRTTLPPGPAAYGALQVAPTGDWIAVTADAVASGHARAPGDAALHPVVLPRAVDPLDEPAARAPSRLTAWLSPDGDRAFVHDLGWPGVLDLRRGVVTRRTDEYDHIRDTAERVRWLNADALLCEWVGAGRRRVRFCELGPRGAASEFEPHEANARRDRAHGFLCDPAGERVLVAWIRPTGPQGWLRGNLWHVDVDDGVWTTRGTATPAATAGRHVDAAWCEGRVLLAELRGRAGRGACHLTFDAGGPDARSFVPATAAAWEDVRVDAVGRGAVVRAERPGRPGESAAVKTWLVDTDAALTGTLGAPGR